MKQPRAIIVTTTDKGIHRVIPDDVDMFLNTEAGTWDAIPAFFYASPWSVARGQYDEEAAAVLHSYDVDRAYPLW